MVELVALRRVAPRRAALRKHMHFRSHPTPALRGSRHLWLNGDILVTPPLRPGRVDDET